MLGVPHRTQAAIDAQQGLQLYTMEQLAARLAGGFLQPIDDDALNGHCQVDEKLVE